MNGQRINGKGGFSLMETVVALFVLTIGIMGVFALFPAGLTASQDAMEDSRVSLLAEAILSDLRMELNEDFSDNGSTYGGFTDNDSFTGTLTANAPGGSIRLLSDAQTGTPIGRFRLTVRPHPDFPIGTVADATLECWPGPGTTDVNDPVLDRQRKLVFNTRIVDRSQ